MASLLCHGCCSALSNTCDALRIVCHSLGQIVCAPFRLCCHVSANLGSLLCSPFALFLLLAIGLNVPSIYFGIILINKDDIEKTCDEWLVKNAILCAIHIVVALYIVGRILAQPPPAQRQQQQQHLEEGFWYNNWNYNPSKANSSRRIQQVVCDDPIVAIYILVFVFCICWTSFGVSKLDDGCDQDTAHWLHVALACHGVYLWLGGLTFCCSSSCRLS